MIGYSSIVSTVAVAAALLAGLSRPRPANEAPLGRAAAGRV